MADNVAITPGSGATVAADDIDGVLHQRVKIVLGDDGQNAGDVSLLNPIPTREAGELVEALEAMRIGIQALTRTIGQTYPDVAGRLRVAVDSISASLTLAAVTTVTTVSTVSSVTNQAQVGGFAAQDQVPALMHLSADSLRRNIAVT